MESVKILAKLIEELENSKFPYTDSYCLGYNRGLDAAISLIEEKINQIEEINN